MFRAIVVIAACLSILWFHPTPAEACGVKMSIKAPRAGRRVVARRASPTPRQALVARRPIRVGPSTRSPVAAGGSASASGQASVEASTPDESTEPATPTEETAPDEETRVATADTAKEPVEAEAVVEPEPEPKEARVPARFSKRVFFGQANAVLSSKAKRSLIRNARWLKRHEDRSVVVEGHCSVTGPAAPNMALSEARAEAVKDYLVEMGVDESRIETKGYGLTKPKYKPASSPKNRRVIIRVRKD